MAGNAQEVRGLDLIIFGEIQGFADESVCHLVIDIAGLRKK